jgi:hypothetical protein
VRLAVLLTALLTLAAPAAAAPPAAGTLVPGRSLGGIELGATAAEGERRWGRAYGVCRGCARTTWYFNYYAFQPRGAGVELRAGRVTALFTLYQPAGWSTSRGLTLGDPVARVTALYGSLVRRECGGYAALELPRGQATTAFYVVDERVWGFGLSDRGVPVCR